MSLQGLITINLPPSELIKGEDTDILYNEKGSIVGDSNFTYQYGTATPTITLGGSSASLTGTIKLGGATGSGSIVANTIALASSSGISSNSGTGTWVHGGSSSTAKPLVSFEAINPVLEWKGTNNGANMKRWQMYMDGSGNLYTTAVSDDGNTAQQAVQITRTATNVTSHRFFIGGTINMALDNTGLNVTGDVNNSGNVIAKGVSAATNPAAVAGPTNTGASIGGAANYALIALYDATQTANARSADIINFQNKLQFRLKNDAGSSTVIPLSFNGGYAGYTGITSNGGWNHTGSLGVTGQLYSGFTSTVGVPALYLASSAPRMEFNATNGSAGRKRWGIDATGGVWFGMTLQGDGGANQVGVYRVYNGTNTVGGHIWYLGGNTSTNAASFQGMCLQTTSTGVQGMSIGPANPVPSAFLDLQSTAKGFLVPRMTTAQRTAIPSPAQSLIVFDTDKKALCIYGAGSDSTKWYTVGTAVITPDEDPNPVGPTEPEPLPELPVFE